MTYNPSFDIVRSCKDAKEIDFIWHGIDEVKTDDGIIMRQVNNVMRCTAFRRRTKRLAKLSDAQVLRIFFYFMFIRRSILESFPLKWQRENCGPKDKYASATPKQTCLYISVETYCVSVHALNSAP